MSDPRERRFVPSFAELVESLGDATRERLMASRGAAIDPRKVLTPSEQVMRALAVVPRDRWAALPASARAAMDRLVPAPGMAPRAELGGGGLALVEAGLAFAIESDLVCPAAIRLQLPPAPGEDPRSARALYARLSDEAIRVLSHGALRDRAGGPRPLALGELLERTESPRALTREIEAAPPATRRALAAIEARGGEVSRDAFLELAQEPARYGSGAGLPLRGGTAQTLLAFGFVVPVGHDRYVLPTEVARVAGRERREVLARRQAEVRARIDARDEETLRAELAGDPGALALALMVELIAAGELTAADRPLARSAIARAAKLVHVAPERAELLVTLVRSLSLRAMRVRDVAPALIELYRGGGLGDESRLFPARPSRKLGATGIVALRELALDTLASLPRGRFVPRAEVIAAARSDLRAEGIELGLRDLARSAPADVSPSIERALELVLTVSLPALGLVDVSDDGALRASSRAARGGSAHGAPTPPRWEGTRARFDADTAVRHALALAPVARAGLDPELVLVLDASRAAPLAVDRDTLGAALRAADAPASLVDATLAALPAAHAVLEASVPVRWIRVEDGALRERLLADPAIARIVLPNGPENGLLVHEHGSFTRLVRLFAKHGVDLRKLA